MCHCIYIFNFGACDHRTDNSCSVLDICTIERYVCKAIVDIFMLKTICLPIEKVPNPPSTHTHTATIYSLAKIFGFPQAFKIMDVCHIRIKVVANYADDCINPKLWSEKSQEAKIFKHPSFYQECLLFG